jgi:acyl-homoserine-lactone acylase
MRAALVVLAALLALPPAAAFGQEDYDVTIRRTAHGIPHLEARDFGSIGYGYGYAFAQDNLCVMADQYVTVRGERSRFFGPDGTWSLRGNGTTNRNLDSDFFFKRIIKRRTIERLLAAPPPNGPREEVRAAVRGYVAGYNRYLRETGVANLPDPACRGQAWVRPIEEIDAYRRFYQLALLASSGVAINGIGGAQPPPPGPVTGSGAPPSPSRSPSPQGVADQLGGALPDVLGGIGSNAYGIGRDQTDNGKGLLLGNPHFPWDGTERFYQAHATIPGRLDVQGAALFGVPVVLIGNTRGLAWSHTVSTAFRFTPFELTLVPGSPTTYLVDGQPKEMERDELVVDVRRPDGSIGQERRTLYTTQWGPVFTELLGLPAFPWTPVKAFALGDANAENFRYLNHFLETNLAQSAREYDAVLRRNQGIPWVNSIAADGAGEAYYADISVVPHVTNEHAERCNTVVGRATFSALGLPVLDGSRSGCSWGRDPSAIQPGTLGPAEHLPSMFRSDYVMNSNDSYWLGNLKQRLEGFPRIVGDERTERTLRTRLGLLMVDGARFSQRSLMDTVFNNRQYAGELWRDALVGACDQIPGQADACAALRAWDVRDDLGSRGALLFRRIAQRLLGEGTVSAPPPWSEPYSNDDPANTPRGLNTADPRVRQAIVEAADELRRLQIPLDAPLGSVQAETRNGERLPIHGGPGTAGVFNAINVRSQDLEPRTGYGTVPHGSSYVQVVQFARSGCPAEPRTILTYSQSTNRESPYFSDQTRMYGRKEWVDVPFCPDEVRRATLSELRLRSRDGSAASARCPERRLLRRARVTGGRRLRVSWADASTVGVDVFRVTAGRTLLGQRRMARLRGRAGRRALGGRRFGAGIYVVRFRGRRGQERVALRRRAGRWSVLRRFERTTPCGPVRRFKLERPAFGGRRNEPLGIAFRLSSRARVDVRVTRRGRLVKRWRSSRRAGITHRLRLASEGLPRGAYRVTLLARGPAGGVRIPLGAQRV